MNPLQFEIQYECLQNLANGASRIGVAGTTGGDPSLEISCAQRAICPEFKLNLSKLTNRFHRLKFSVSIASKTNPPTAKDLEWKLTYVGSAEDDAHDQVLDTVLVGPVGVGSYKFVFQADPPDVSKIPQSDVLGVTVLLLTCAYNGTEFIRVGYYVNNEYADEELRENPPSAVRLDRVVRNILAEKPRVTRFPCEFDAPSIPTANEMDDLETENDPVDGYGFGAPSDCAPVDAALTSGVHPGFGYGGDPAGHGLAEMRY